MVNILKLLQTASYVTRRSRNVVVILTGEVDLSVGFRFLGSFFTTLTHGNCYLHARVFAPLCSNFQFKFFYSMDNTVDFISWCSIWHG